MKSSKRIILIALMLGMIVTTALAEEKGSFSKINQESIIIVPYYTYTWLTDMETLLDEITIIIIAGWPTGHNQR